MHNTSKLRRLRLISLVIAGVLFIGCGQSNDHQVDPETTGARLQQNLITYGERLETALDTLQTSHNVETIRDAVQALLDLSVPILDDYMSLHPESQAYLRAAKTCLHRLHGLSEEAIEREYHEGTRLPERPEDGGTAYHVKDLLVHPATVLILLRDADLDDRRADMVHEIERTQSHLNAVLRAVRQNSS